MKWSQLLSRKRLGKPDIAVTNASRTDFQKDFDRIVFSSAFRRLQDKTQVFPLTRNDYVRTRLTHSLEVSSIGRSLGTLSGDIMIQRHQLQQVTAADFGAIVASACLAHDIGNPPFGHTGEHAIRHWIKKQPATLMSSLTTQAEQHDFLNFEGNAQGFRILSRLQNAMNPGGMQLTCATLGAFSKYPQASDHTDSKHGFFSDDQSAFQEVATELNLRNHVPAKAWCRHPLAFLMEAADDICYRIIDIEDGYRAGYLSFNDTAALLIDIIREDHAQLRLQQIAAPNEKIEYLRAQAINTCINQVLTCFLDTETAILNGQHTQRLVTQIPSAHALQTLQDIATQTIYVAREVVEVGAAGFQVIGGLLTTFHEAVEITAQAGESASAYSQNLMHLFPKPQISFDQQSAYQRLLAVTDFVSGMTDSYAVSLYKKITGISLPGN